MTPPPGLFGVTVCLQRDQSIEEVCELPPGPLSDRSYISACSGNDEHEPYHER